MWRRTRRRIRLIRRGRSYSVSELAALLGVHVRTVQAWHHNGMSPIDFRSHPLLFYGKTVKAYLRKRSEAGRVKLDFDEFFCPRCKLGRESLPEHIQIVETHKTVGKNDEQVLIRGRCRVCGCRLTRFSTAKRSLLFRFSTMLKERDRVLKGKSNSSSKTDLSGDGK